MNICSKNYYICIFCLLAAAVPFLSVDTPRGIAFLSSIIAVVYYATYYFVFQEKPRFSKTTAWLLIIIFCLSALSIIWAKYSDESINKVMRLAFLFPPQVLLISLALSFNKEQLRPYIYLFSYGVSFAAIFLCFEILSGGVFFNLIRGESIFIDADPDEFNRATPAIALYSLSAFALLKTHTNKIISFGMVFIPVVGSLLITQSQSAQLLFVVLLFFLFVFPYGSKLAWTGLKILILGLMLGAPFFVSFVYQNYAATIQELPMMARGYAGHRLEIWDYISRYALQEPVHGFGIEATRAITNFDSKEVFSEVNTVLHPHNFVFQIWIEFGVVGILIAMGLMITLLSMIERKFTVAQQKILLPTMMAILVPASTAFGMWQGWWIALLFHLAAMCLIACKFTDDVQKKECA